MNQSKKIYVEGGSVPNTRLHTLFVTFPGFGKSFFLRQFLENEFYSLVKGSQIASTFEGNITEAGFTGSVKMIEGEKEPIFSKGLCQQESNSIVGIEEFSSITNAFQQTHNVGLDTSILLALDSGNVVKRLGPGKIGYHTNITLWAGVQPARFDLGSGFARRFIFMTFYPTLSDIQRYREARRKMKGISISKSQIKSLHMGLNQRLGEIHHNLRKIYFSQDFYAELNKLDIMHYEDELYERLALGYWLMRSERVGDQLHIRMDAELRRIIHLEDEYRRTLNQYSPSRVIWNLIRNEEKVKETKVYNVCIAFGIDVITINAVLRTLYVTKKIKKVGKDLEILKTT